jgi:hypothetical protein
MSLYNSYFFNICIYKNSIWFDIPKTGSSSIINHFVKIKNKNKFILLENDKLQKEKLKLFFKNKNKKYKLFFHLRNPWQRFLAGVRQDIMTNFGIEFPNRISNSLTKKLEEKNKKLRKKIKQKDIIFFCKIFKKKYLDLDFFDLNKMFYHQNESIQRRVLYFMPLIKDYVKKIEMWNFDDLAISIKKNWGTKILERRNQHNQFFKSIVFNYFNNKKKFKKLLEKKLCIDFLLYNLTKEKSPYVIDIKQLTKILYKKPMVIKKK